MLPSRLFLIGVVLALLGLAAGCFQWTEDQNGNLRSVGLPGMPVWESKQPAPTLSPSQMGFSPEEASKMSGPVLVIPPTPPSQVTRFKYYQTGNNQCEEDLHKLLAQQQAGGNSDTPPPYCTDHPTAPQATGRSMAF